MGNSETALSVVQGGVAKREQVGEADVNAVINRVALMQQVYRKVMLPDVHYGSIPGTGKDKAGQPKKVLFKAGAELLNVAFQFAGSFPPDRIHRVLEKDFIFYEVTCTLTHMGTGAMVGEGIGCCSSREEKYAYRKGKIVCPDCHAEAIFKSKMGPGWYCYQKAGGCGKKWTADNAFDPKDAAKVPNENIYEQANTILKMAEKRALVAATLNATAASDIFTQDLDQFVEEPDKSEWHTVGSKEAQQESARRTIQELESQSVRGQDGGGHALDDASPSEPPPDIPELVDDEIPTGKATTQQRGTTRKTGASSGLTAAQIRFQGELKPVKEAYLMVGDEAGYRAIVRSFFVEKSTEITAVDKQRKFLKALKNAAFQLEQAACGAALYKDPKWLALFPDEQTAIRRANFVYWTGKQAKNTMETVESICAEQIGRGFTGDQIHEWWSARKLEVEAKLKENHEKQ